MTDDQAGYEIQEQAWREFEDWLAQQPDDIQELSTLEQIEIYATAGMVEGVH